MRVTMDTVSSSYRWLWLALGAMVVVRITIWASYLVNPDLFLQPDSHDYRFLGAQFFEQGMFTSFSRTPVYPLFIGFLETKMDLDLPKIVLIQIAISLANGFLVWRLFRCYWLPRQDESLQPKTPHSINMFWVGLLSLFIFGFDLVSAFGANYLLSETLFTLLSLLCANWLMDIKHGQYKHHQLAVALRVMLIGVTLGLATLCRPIAVFLPVAIVIWGVTDKRLAIHKPSGKQRQILLFALMFVISSVFSVGWMMRNQEKTGVTFLTTISSINLYEYRAAWNIAQRDGRSFESVQAEFRENKINLQKQRGLNEGELAKAMGEQGLALILSTPLETLHQGGKGFVHLYFGVFGAAIDDWLGVLGIGPDNSVLPLVVKLGVLGHSIFIYLGVLWLLIYFVRRRKAFSQTQRSLVVLSLVLVGYFTMLSVGVEAYARFRIPMIPFLSLLSVIGWVYAIRHGLGRRTPWRIGE